jgi:quinol-cytochrome oxidoreductase complex cytochrome b subunit
MKSRGGLIDLLLHLHPRTVPEGAAKFTYTWCLGGLALWMFLIEVVTGLLLGLYYVPSPRAAYGSILDITHAVPYGFFVRNLHYWAGQIMVVLVALHTTRVFVTGAFAAPRNANWIIGLGLLVGTFFVDFTGYLLVWDDRALWARVIAGNLAATVPLVGPTIGGLLFGFETPPEIAIARVYLWHVVMAPTAMVVGMAWHFWRIRKDGISDPL